MKGLLFFLLATFFMPQTTFAYVGFGICNFGKERVEHVICYGPTVLNETMVSGEVKVAGPLKAYKVLMESMTITGAARVQNSSVSGPVIVKGYLYASSTIFEKDLIVTSNRLDLDHVLIKGSVTMHSDKDKPYIKLQCGSRVMGSVTFDGVAGVVQMTDDSKVEGKIQNGVIEFIKQKC